MKRSDLGLVVEPFLMAASEETGSDDFGGPDIGERLGRYFDALAEANLNDFGLLAQRADVHRLLVNRLRCRQWFARHPEILAEDVSDPILIIGLPRTGTTKLQRMLACHPEVQNPALWRLLNPAPFPEPDGERVPRVDVAEIQVSFMRGAFPDAMAGHPIGTDQAEEDILLQEPTFDALVNVMRLNAPTFLDSILTGGQHDGYAYERDMLRFLQWQDGGKRGRPWILKSPLHLGNLDHAAQLFPDVTVVHCHRELGTVIPSALRLIEVYRRMLSDDVDLEELGDQMITLWAGETARNLEQRRRLSDAVPIIDFAYDDICRKPLDVIGRILEQRGGHVSSEAAACMSAWETDNPQHRHGKHVYSADRYGISRIRIEHAFHDYIDRFGTTADGA